jgi:lipoic acid synthetase
VKGTNRKPDWIRYKTPGGPGYLNVKKCVEELNLHTICTEAKCPNAGECFGQNTATFLILGSRCTRDCLYCAVEKGMPYAPDPGEPDRIAEAVRRLGLKYAVITSVTRDDLDDGGASFFFFFCIRIKEKVPGCGVELLIPDFRHSLIHSLGKIRTADPDVLNHNIETVKDCFSRLRPSGDYEHSLKLLKAASEMGFTVKSGLMIGFGETVEDIHSTMRDLIEAGCSILTAGQYLSPGRNSYPVAKYYHPDEFEEIKIYGMSLGFKAVQSAPNVRSSYHAALLSDKQNV